MLLFEQYSADMRLGLSLLWRSVWYLLGSLRYRSLPLCPRLPQLPWCPLNQMVATKMWDLEHEAKCHSVVESVVVEWMNLHLLQPVAALGLGQAQPSSRVGRSISRGHHQFPCLFSRMNRDTIDHNDHIQA